MDFKFSLSHFSKKEKGREILYQDVGGKMSYLHFFSEIELNTQFDSFLNLCLV